MNINPDDAHQEDKLHRCLAIQSPRKTMTTEARAGRRSEVANREGATIERPIVEAPSASVTHFNVPPRPLVHNNFHLNRLLPPAYHPAIMAKERSKLFFCMHWRVAPPRAKVWLGISVMADTRALIWLQET
jgi:hypothetical protein